MTSVYDPEAFSTRVSYARRCILNGHKGGRAFDTCFEMCDGDAVVTALVRKADHDPRLAKAMGTTWLSACRRTAMQYNDVPTSQLSVLARRLRHD